MNKDDWDEACGRGIFALVLAVLIFAPLAFGGVGPWVFLVIQALVIGVMALWTLRLWLSPKPQFLWPPIAWAVLAFVLYAIGRYLKADLEYPARQELIQVLVCSFLFLAVLNNTYHQGMTQSISYTLIFLAMATSSYAIGQYLTNSTRVWNLTSPDVGRAMGTFMSPDHLCAFLEMILPLAVAFLVAGRIKPLMRVLMGYSILVILGGVVVTFSRAGWAAAIAGAVFVLLALASHRSHRKYAVAILLLLIGGGIVFATRFLPQSVTYMRRVMDAEGKVNLDIFVRMKLWLAGFHMWLDHFWWGAGPGAFDWRFNEYRPQSVQLRPGWPHCDYLNLLTDWGMVGGVIALAAMVACWFGIKRTWQRVRRSENDFGNALSNRFAFFLGAVGSMVALAIHSLVDFNLHVPAVALLAATLLALMTSHLRFATERYWIKIRLPVKLTATLTLIAGMAYLGGQEFRLGQEALWLGRATKQPDFSLARAQVLEKAFTIEPKNFETAYNLGECYRRSATIESTNFTEQLDTALKWYQTGEKLNPYYSLNYLRQGICMDSQGQHDEAEKYFIEAGLHDPNGNYTAAFTGWHYWQAGRLAPARLWLLRSLELQPLNNQIATTCLPLVEMDLTERAANF